MYNSDEEWMPLFLIVKYIKNIVISYEYRIPIGNWSGILHEIYYAKCTIEQEREVVCKNNIFEDFTCTKHWQ